MRMVAVRAFGLDRQTLIWDKLLGHVGFDNTYAGSGINDNLLVLAFNTNKSHKAALSTSDTEFVALRTDSGDSTSTSCLMVFASATSAVKLLDLKITAEHGAYALMEVTAGTVVYMKTGVEYEFSEGSYALVLLDFDAVTDPQVPTLNLLDVMSIAKTSPQLAGHAISRLLLYFPSGYEDYGVPEILLVGHLDPAEKTGLLIFGFSKATCPSTISLVESYNPFVTNVSCGSSACARCLSANTAKCLQCVEGGTTQYFLSDRFSCAAGACPAGYFAASTRHCERCHYSCLACTGPLQTQCATCDSGQSRTLYLYAGECRCTSGLKYSENAKCTATCPVGFSGLMGSLNACVSKCPLHTFHFADYASNSAQPSTGSLSTTEGSDSLYFTPSATSCLSLPGPTGATAVPDQFTVSFWLYPSSGWTTNTKTLLWAFNVFSIRCDVSGGVYTARLILHQSTGDLAPVSSSFGVLTANDWNFVTVSVRTAPGLYEAYLYVAARTAAIFGDAVRVSSSSGTLDYGTYVNQLFLGCAGSVSATGIVSMTQGIDFTGYARELVYQGRYYERPNIEANKYLVYSSCLESYKWVLGYWRFDVLDTVAGGFQLRDGSRFGKTVVIPAGGVPAKSSSTPGLPLCNSLWEALGTCVDLFDESNFPNFSFDLRNFGASEIATRINLNDKSMLAQLFHKGDKLIYVFGDCSSTPILNSAAITPQSDGSISIEAYRSLPDSVAGKHVSICYYSAISGNTRLLGKTYFVTVPVQVSPSHGASEAGSTTPISFTLEGGDQSSSDLLTLVNIEQDTAVGIEDTIMIDEALSTYAVYSAGRQKSGSYAGISTAGLDRGTYTVAWRPGYMYQSVSSQLVTYKNLFITWNLQEVPRAKFPPLDGVANSFKNTVAFKAELLTLNLVGLGQRDGDQIIFCYTGCQYSNRVGPVFSRVNGRYPSLWFGETVGVFNLLDNSAYDRVYICWRPYARAAEYDPDDDAWYSVLDAQKVNTAAYILINSMTDNADLPEIAATNPPMTKPVLHKGESIWFQISGCSVEKMKPTMHSGVPGKVQLLHLTYSAYNHSSYTTEVVWEQQFTAAADLSVSGFTVGKLSGDYDTCNYTLQDIPQSLLQPGHDYMLGIYSRSFMTPTNKFLFGNLATGVLQFKHIFTYQESEFSVTYRKYVPSESEIVVHGANLGDLLVSGNGFTDTRRLYGVIVTPTVTPACNTLKTSYIALSRYTNPNQIRLQGVNMAGCNGSLSLAIKLIKISDSTEAPLWYYSDASGASLAVGFIGCHYTCKTCNGTEYTDCLTCNASTGLGHLYKNQCVRQCGDDYPYPEVIYGVGTVVMEYYKCVKICSSGYYLDKGLGLCIQCNAQCRTCTSGDTMSCNDCKGVAVAMTNATLDFNNTFKEAYFFKKMCMLECPNIVNDFNPSLKLVEPNDYTRTCVISNVPSGSHPISVSIQPIIYPQKLNIKRSIYLRALIQDPTSNLATIFWVAHPDEDKSANGFYSSDKRIFSTYTEDNLNSSITVINMNSFNYKSETDVMRLVVKVATSDSIAFDIIELYGNRPPELSDDSVTFTPSSGYATGSSFNVKVTGAQDADDAYTMLKFKILLVPRAYAIPDSYESSTSQSVLLLLAQITANTMTLYPSTLISEIEDSTVTLKDIYIPPLMNGPQTVNGEVETSVITADVFVYIEDRFMGVSKAKFTINITETYRPAAREATIAGIHSLVLSLNSTLTWELALRIAHTFRVTNPSSSLYYMSYLTCSKDSQCGGHGKCMMSGGWSECMCDSGYVGTTCDWTANELTMVKEVSRTVLSFLNVTIIKSFDDQLEDDPSYTTSDTNLLDQLANVLIGMLKNTETVDERCIPTIVKLLDYMTRLNLVVGGRLLDFERTNILTAIDSIIKFVYHHLRKSLYDFYVLGEDRKQNDPEIEANFSSRRKALVDIVMTLRNGLYNFVSAISTTQYPDDSPFYSSQDTFEVFLTAVKEKSLFQDYEHSLGVKFTSASGYVRLPMTVLESVRNSVSYDEEFKIRAIRWVENPYVFSDYHSEVSTSVYSLALLDSNGSALNLQLSDPIVFFLPLTNSTKHFPNDKLKCKYFNDSMRANVTQAVAKKVNVNTLNMTDSQKKLRYPEWDPKLYTYADLIVETKAYDTAESSYPEFADSQGISSYGTMLKLSEYVDTVPCAAYHLSEVAAVVQRGRSMDKALAARGFYYGFDPLATVNFNIGMHVCIVVAILFIAAMFVSWFIDIMLIPKQERIINLHRNEYSDKEAEVGLTNETPPSKTVTKNSPLKHKSTETQLEDIENKHAARLASDVKLKGSPGSGGSAEGDGKQFGLKGSCESVSVSISAGEGSISGNESDGCGSAGDEGKIETGSIVRVKRRRRRKSRKLSKNDGGEVGPTTGGTGPTQEDLKKRGTMCSVGSQGQTKGGEGGNKETTIDTSLNHTTAQELSTIAIMRANSGKLESTEEGGQDREFACVKAGEIRRRGKESHHVEDIFSKEYIARSEEEQFTALNIFTAANPILNLCFRTNTIYTRPMRCVLLFCYLYFILFWAAVLLTSSLNSLDHSEDTKRVGTIVISHLWVMACGPIFTNVIMFLVGGVFKLNEARMREAKTMTQYRMYMAEISRHRNLRYILGYSVIALGVMGANYYMCKFSLIYGWKASTQWVWLSLLSLVFDMLVYDVALAFIMHAVYWTCRETAIKFQRLRALKQADVQE